MFKVQEGAIAGYAPSTEIVTKVALFSIFMWPVKELNYRIKRTCKKYFGDKPLKLQVVDVVEVWVPDIDHRKSDSRYILGVIKKADVINSLMACTIQETRMVYEIGGVHKTNSAHAERILLTSWTFNQFPPGHRRTLNVFTTFKRCSGGPIFVLC